MTASALPVTDAALYTGVVVHRRFAPRRHALRYRLFMALLDIDRLDAIGSRLRLFSRNRFNLLSFHDRDHLPEDAAGDLTLRAHVDAQLAGAGIAIPGGTVRLLSLPRVLGYAFNPLSVYFCHHADGAPAALLYEVNNTFGQRHTYVMPVAAEPDGSIRQSCRKAFYVSPFLDMDMTYHFRIVPPGAQIAVAIDGFDGTSRMIAASFAGAHRPFTDEVIWRTFLGHPLVGVMVIAGIHWEALKLWRKGIRLRSRPTSPARPATFVSPREV